MCICQVTRSLVFFLTLCRCLVVMAGEHTALRRWTDNTGTFSAKATLVSVDQPRQRVTLRLADGRDVTVPLRRLSDQDQAFVSRNGADHSVREPLRIAGLDWYEDLNDARSLARGGIGSTDDKPILCFRVLGDMEGFM